MKKILLGLVILILITNQNSFATEKVKKTKLAPKAELITALQEIHLVVSNCDSKHLDGLDTIRIIGIPKSVDQDFLEKSKKVEDELRDCIEQGSNKINSLSKFVLDEMGKRNLREFGAEYIVQNKTLLESIGNENLFARESQKFSTLFKRIDLELSVQK